MTYIRLNQTIVRSYIHLDFILYIKPYIKMVEYFLNSNLSLYIAYIKQLAYKHWLAMIKQGKSPCLHVYKCELIISTLGKGAISHLSYKKLWRVLEEILTFNSTSRNWQVELRAISHLACEKLLMMQCSLCFQLNVRSIMTP